VPFLMLQPERSHFSVQVQAARMSDVGQTQTSARSPAISVPPPIADIIRLHAQVRFVPRAENETSRHQKVSVAGHPCLFRNPALRRRCSVRHVYTCFLGNHLPPWESAEKTSAKPSMNALRDRRD
jgi:hypothetical protein